MMQPLDLMGPEGPIDGTLHLPDGAGPWPAAIMLCDIRGPRADFFTMADKLAVEGFVTFLPNVYYRLGRAPVPDPSAPMQELLKLKATLTPQRMTADAQSLVEGMLALPQVAGSSLAVVGYCMTGAMAVRAAATAGERIAAAASFHGGNLVTPDADSPHLLAPVISAEMYFGHADSDPMMPAADISTLEQAFAQAGVSFRSEIYPGAAHGFAVPGPRYDAPAAQRHWDALLGLLRRHFDSPGDRS